MSFLEASLQYCGGDLSMLSKEFCRDFNVGLATYVFPEFIKVEFLSVTFPNLVCLEGAQLASWEKKSLHAGDVIFLANAWLHDFLFYRRASRSISCSPRQVSWKTPSIGWLKINMNGAFSSDKHSGGIGIVVRDDTGQWVSGKCMTVSDLTSPEQVEAIAGRFAVRMARECEFSLVVFETDSMILTIAVRQQSYTSLIGPVYENIVDDLSTMPGSSFHHIFRQTNEAAHHLALHALLSNSCTSWELTPPTFLTDVLMKDLYPSSSFSN
ncbi:hypothetical protein M0R45_006239 [Rubus argutus]|uniref:RNase H type-1 domain-containing protein n=1 Tax=Rubus argutus TaxID=59490 RepID=A0AAW1YQN1_RUBAR